MNDLKSIAEKINKIKRINMRLSWVVNIFSFGVIIWAEFNNHKNTLGEQIFLSLSLMVLFYNLYLLKRLTKILPPPKEDKIDIWKEYVTCKLERSIRAITLAEWRVLYPIFIITFGILSMEFENDQGIWLYLSIVIALVVLGYWRANWSINFMKKKYEEVTGSKHIEFFI